MASALEIYNIKALGSGLYAELWGCANLKALMLVEHRFLRSLLNLPSSTPLIPLYLDLGQKRICEKVDCRLLTYWYHLWMTASLESYLVGLRELLALPRAGLIPWLISRL